MFDPPPQLKFDKSSPVCESSLPQKPGSSFHLNRQLLATFCMKMDKKLSPAAMAGGWECVRHYERLADVAHLL